MSAIQRWAMYSHASGYRVEDCEQAKVPWFDATTQRWCKSEDVEELERLLAHYLKTLSELRTEVTSRQQIITAQRTEILHCMQHIESLDAERTEIIQVCRHEMGG